MRKVILFSLVSCCNKVTWKYDLRWNFMYPTIMSATSRTWRYTIKNFNSNPPCFNLAHSILHFSTIYPSLSVFNLRFVNFYSTLSVYNLRFVNSRSHPSLYVFLNFLIFQKFTDLEEALDPAGWPPKPVDSKSCENYWLRNN